MRITDFEIVDHGIDHSQYFQGCGTSHTDYDHVATGVGDNPAEAYDDACEMIAQQHDGDCVGPEFDARVLEGIDHKRWPTSPSVQDELDAQRDDNDDDDNDDDDNDDDCDCYYYLSIRYNVE